MALRRCCTSAMASELVAAWGRAEADGRGRGGGQASRGTTGAGRAGLKTRSRLPAARPAPHRQLLAASLHVCDVESQLLHAILHGRQRRRLQRPPTSRTHLSTRLSTFERGHRGQPPPSPSLRLRAPCDSAAARQRKHTSSSSALPRPEPQPAPLARPTCASSEGGSSPSAAGCPAAATALAAAASASAAASRSRDRSMAMAARRRRCAKAR
jgi:hypothetical protein